MLPNNQGEETKPSRQVSDKHSLMSDIIRF
jgi:hypothetical protein